ncbi:hypothetical protein [Xenorhabdus sp. SGI246]|uniref:hypothetical protein n=1 Tax=Xenorhabdus sp. SGI246 TaxID=3158263 RepID=UPI00349FACF6
MLSIIRLLLGKYGLIRFISLCVSDVINNLGNKMKKYILLCLLAGTTLLASTQTYAMICAGYLVDSPAWKDCMAQCELTHPEFIGKVICA